MSHHSQLSSILPLIHSRIPSIAPDAYFFLCDAMHYASKHLNDLPDQKKHITARQLLEGISKYAIETFGPMATTTLREWGIGSSEDIGTMVYALIQEGFLGKNDADRIEDFQCGFHLFDSLQKPFLP